MSRPAPTKKHLAAVIRRLREERQLSQEAAADAARIHRNYQGMIERAERNPSFESLRKILMALGISWTEFGSMLDREAQR